MNEILFIILAIFIMIIVGLISFREGKEVGKKNMISHILKETSEDCEEYIYKKKWELMKGAADYERELSRIEDLLSRTHLTLSDVGIDEWEQNWMVRMGASQKIHSLFKELLLKGNTLLPINRRYLIKEIFSEIEKSKINPNKFELTVEELRCYMTKKEWNKWEEHLKTLRP